MTTITTALTEAKQAVDAIDARVLLQHVLKVDRAYLIAHSHETFTPDVIERYEQLVARRATGEPIAYIIGQREFYGLTFKVTPAVLIPRPETELLVEQALVRLSEHSPTRVLDLGTGSGAIAIAIARHRPQASIVAVDRSPEALAIARENADILLRDRASAIDFRISDWFSALDAERFDVIVSNPPYVADNDPHLSQGDLRFEPKLALAAGPRGLDFLAHIAREAAPRLAPGGWLLLEHGYDQRDACLALMGENGYVEIACSADIANIPRVTVGQRRNNPLSVHTNL